MNNFTVRVFWADVDIDVTGTYYPYRYNGYLEPPDEEDFEIDKVEINGVDITKIVDYFGEADNIAAKCIEKAGELYRDNDL